MFGRSLQISRFPPKANRFLQPQRSPTRSPRIIHTKSASHSFAWNNQSLLSDRNTTTQAPKKIPTANITKNYGTAELKRESVLRYTNLHAINIKREGSTDLHNIRPQRLRKRDGRLVRLRFVSRRVRSVKALRYQHVLRYRLCEGSVDADRGFNLSNHRSGLGEPRHLPTPRSLRGFLKAQSTISLGTWSKPTKASCSDFGQVMGRHTVDEIITRWSMRLTCLVEGRPIRAFRTIRIEAFVRKYAKISMSRKTLHQMWLHLPLHLRLDKWQDVMLWSMQNSPNRALMLLLATLKGRRFRPPRYMVHDCLNVLARHFLFKASQASPNVFPAVSSLEESGSGTSLAISDGARAHSYLPAPHQNISQEVPYVPSKTKTIFQPDPWALNAISRIVYRFMEGASPEELRLYSISQDAMQLLLKHCDDAQALSLYKTLTLNRADLYPNTMLHFLERFVHMGQLGLSLKILKEISSEFPRFLSVDQTQMACVKLLRTCWGNEAPYRIQSAILSQVLEMGIRPNQQLFNVILLNMVEGYDFDTAWQMFDIAKQSHTFQTDSITYGILAKGAKLSKDSSVLDKVLCDTEHEPELRSERLLTDVLGAIGALSPNHEYSAMLDFYKRHFDLRPLQELRLLEVSDKVQQNHDLGRKWPSKYVLGQMILAYNKSYASSADLVQRYSAYRKLIEEEHPLIAPLARDDYVANSFIMAFGQYKDTLPYCTSVVKHMISPPSSPNSLPYATPTVQTWSILLAAYMRHKQKLAAEKVLNMMSDRGLKPDKVTWNTLICGYAAMQDVGAVVGAMREMEAAGFEPDARTLKALDRISHRQELLDMLKVSMEKTSAIKQPVDSEYHRKPASAENDGKVRQVAKYLADHQQDIDGVTSTDVQNQSEENRENGFSQTFLDNSQMDKPNTRAIRDFEKYPQMYNRDLEVRKYLENYPQRCM